MVRPELAAYCLPAVIKCQREDSFQLSASGNLTIGFLGIARNCTKAWSEISWETRHLLGSRDELNDSLFLAYNSRYYNYNNICVCLFKSQVTLEIKQQFLASEIFTPLQEPRKLHEL